MEKINDLQDQLDKFIPKDLNITDNTRRMEIAKMFKEFYFDGKSITQINKNSLTQVIN